MVQYYKYVQGEYRTIELSEADIWHSVHNYFFHSKNSTSYKYILFKSLLENISDINANNELTYNAVFDTFAKIAWNLIAGNGLWQSNKVNQRAVVQAVIEDYQERYEIPGDWNYDRIAENQRAEINHKIKQAAKVNVIGATFGDFNEEIYSFNKKTEIIQMNPLYVDFFMKYKRMLIDVNNYQLTLFLEKYNSADKLSGILTKVEIISQRKSLKEFEVLLKEAGFKECFYCKKTLNKAVHVDHFIPWSYVQNDRLWNFVLSCASCNTRKSNKLPNQIQLDEVLLRNEKLLKDEQFAKYFRNYNERKLKDNYKYASQNGFKPFK